MNLSGEVFPAVVCGLLFLGCGADPMLPTADGDGSSGATMGNPPATDGGTGGASASASATVGMSETGATAGADSGGTTLPMNPTSTTGPDPVPTEYPGPVTVPTDLLPECVADPQTLAEAGACAGVRVGMALSRNLGAQYNEIFAREFNALTPENDTKMVELQPSEGTWNFRNADTLLDLATQPNVYFKGHTLIWDEQPPPYLQPFADVAELDAFMEAHISTVVDYYKDAAFAWEVVNEAVAESAPYGALDTVFATPGGVEPNFDYVARAFEMTRAADADALLYYNEFNLETADGKAEGTAAMLEALLDAEVPIDGVAIQGHIWIDIASTQAQDDAGARGYYSPAQLAENMQLFADLGLSVNLSEFDLRATVPGNEDRTMTDEEILAFEVDSVLEQQLYYDFVSVCLEQPACDAITFWGLNEADSWILDTFGERPLTLYDSEFNPRPGYAGAMQAFLDHPIAP